MFEATRRARALVAAGVALILVSPFLSVVPGAAAAELVPVVIDLSKTTSAPVDGTAGANESVVFDFTITCSSTQSDCVNLTLTDTFPAPLVFDTVNPNSNYTATSITNGFLLTFTNALDEGGVGLVAGETVSFQAIGHVVGTVDASFDGVTVTNTAYAAVDNPDSANQASDVVQIVAPLIVSSTVTKTVVPNTLTGFPNTPVVFTLGATNTSNAVVDTLQITDPAVGAPVLPYEYLTPTSVTVTYPSGANRVRIDRLTGTTWTLGTVQSGTTPTLPTGVINGLRFTFSNSVATTDIAKGATGTVVLTTRTTASVASLTTPYNATNVASSQAVKATILGNIPTASAPFTINPAAVNVKATKVFSSHDVLGGENITATLGAQNAGDFTLAQMSIVEPQTATTSFADQGFEFVNFNQSTVFWPTGATSVDVTYSYSDLTSTTENWTTRNSLPAVDATRTLIGFTANFIGTMTPGQYATIPFTVHTLAPVNDVSTTNTIRVDAVTVAPVQTDTDTASDTLLRRSTRINTTINKIIAPGSIFANAGAPLLLSLQSQISPRPTSATDTGGSTIGATSFEIEDSDTDFWNVFNPSNIVATEIPSGSKLTILYSTDGGLTYPGELFASTTGPAMANVAIPAGLVTTITGIKFVYTPSVAGTLLQPGFNVQPNIKVRLRTTERASGASVFAPGATVARVENNTATSFVQNTNTGQSATANDSEPVTVTPLPAGGGPGYDLIEKAWIEDEVLARSSQNATTVISWGTGGQEYASVVVSDTPDDSTTATGDPSMGTVSSTVYDSFNLYSIAPITGATDPLIQYDTVSAAEYFSRTTNSWKPLNNGVLCALGCNGGFPGYTLTTAEREDAIGVRLIFVENANRTATPTTGTAPLKNSGVAATTTLNRHISLTFQLRSVLRSNVATAALGSTRGQLYNTGNPGQVNNVAGIEGRDATAAVLWHENDNDEILIIDSSLNVKATKTWIDGPLGVPPVGTAQSLFPIALMTISGQNASVVAVNELKITEPTAGAPFERVNIVQIEKLTGSTDTTSTAVLTYADSTTSAAIGINALVAMTATQLKDVVKIELTKAGPIVPSEIIGLQLHTQLREFLRSSPTTRVVPITVQNQVTATVTDPGGTTTPAIATAPNNIVTDIAAASIDIEAWSYGVVANKSISTSTTEFGSTTSTSTTGSSVSTDLLTPAVHGQPQTAAIQYDNGEAANKRAVVTVSGQPTGNVRTTELVLEDTSPTFWNVYNFVSLDATALTDTRKRVQVDVLIGNGSWGYGVDYTTTSSTISSTCTDGGTHPDCWIIGAPSLTPTLPAMPTGSQTSDIRGLRFTFTNADGSAWEREYNPPLAAKFSVDRRATLVSSSATPVPSTLFTYPSPTPGESVQGVFTNMVTATASARPSAGATPLWTASADATAQIRYQHLPARVMIKKSPVGAQSLNTNIPYKIVVTNTGGTLDRQLGNVIVTDALPVNSSVVPAATMLVVPNDADGLPQSVTSVTSIRVASSSNATLTTPAYTATLGAITGAAPNMHQDIVFDFDDAWVLPRGASITITVNLQFPPQLEAGTQVVNTATVTADQPFETCQWYVDNAMLPQTPRNQVSDCYSSTTVYPLASAPVTIVKGVRGVLAGPLDANGVAIDSDAATAGIQPYDDLGILKTVPGSSVNCSTPNVATGVVAEYYRYPCVPITRPGGTEEWASTFTNGGNIGLTQIVAIDVLPAPGDKGVIVNEDRGSKWTPTLTTYPTLVGLPADATFTVYYVTNRLISTQRCNGADIQATLGMTPATNPPMTSGYQTCYTNNAPVDSVASRNAAWQVLSPTADAATLASVVAMKFVITMTTASPLSPGSKVSIVYQSRTAAVIGLAETGTTIDNQSVAYNSIAAAAAGFDPTHSVVVPNRFVTEPRKVGVAMATGSVEIRKVVTGAAAARSQAAFNVTLTCTSATVAMTPFVVSVPKDTTQIVHNLPLYASCAVSEASTYNQNPNTSSISPGIVIAQAPQTAGLETILDPNPVFSTARPVVQRSTVTNDYPTTTFTLTKTLNVSGAVNAETAGSAVYPNDIYFTAICTFNNGNGTNTNVLNRNAGNVIDLDPGAGTGTYTSPAIPVGSICTVTETASRSAQSTTRIVTVGGVAGTSTASTSAVFTVDDTGNAVAFTDTYGVASLTVNKVIAGDWAATATPAHTTGSFTVNVVCTRQLNSTTALETTFTGSATLSAATTLTHTFTNIAQGSDCTVSETASAGATRVEIRDTTGTVNAVVTAISGTQTRTITNFFDTASLSVTKQVHSDAVDTAGNVVYLDGPYTVNVSCTFQGAAVYATGYSASPMVLTYFDPDPDNNPATPTPVDNSKVHTQTLTGLPAGALCNVVESPTPGNADSVRVDWNAGATSGTSSTTSAVVGPLAANAVAPATVITNFATVNNYYGVGHLTVTKSLRGGATSFGLGPFTIHVECVSGADSTYSGDITLTPSHLTETIDNLAVGSICSVEETGYGRSDPDAVVYIDAFGATDDGAGIDVMATNPVVTIENWYLTGSVTVTKSVIEDAGFTFGNGPFTITLQCDRDVTGPAATISTTVIRVMDPAVPASMTQLFTGLPNGAECTLRETDDGNASSTSITDGTTTSTDAATGITFTVDADVSIHSVVDQLQPAITVTNSFTEAGLRVTKQIDSNALDADGDPLAYGPFPVSVSCLFNSSPVYGTGYSALSPMVSDIVPGTPWDINGLPTGAECTVTEDDVLGAVSTSITTIEAGGIASTTTVEQVPTATIPTAVVVLGARTTTNSVAFQNSYEVGSIELSKQILGDAKTKWGTADFTVSVTCELDDASIRTDDTVFDDVFDRAELLAGVSIDNLPTGADCTITETNTGVATTTEMVVTVPGEPAATTPGATATVTVTNDSTAIGVVVKNTFDYTTISVQKERSGDTTGLYDVGPFEVSLDCTFDGYTLVDADIPHGLVRELNLANSYFTEFEKLPVGADCTVTETKTAGANSTEVRLGTDAPVAGTALDLTTASGISEVFVTNYYELGGLTVNKTIAGDSFLYGDGSPLYGTTGFEVTLSCERDIDGVMTTVPLPYAATWTFGGGNSYTHDFVDLPVGAVCEIAETKKGFAATSTISAPVTILANGTAAPLVSIEVVNDFQLGTLALGKESLGLFAARHAGETFEVTVECWQDVDGTLTRIAPITDGDVRTIRAGELTAFKDLPVPARCTFEETVDGGADLHIYSVSAVPMLGSRVTVAPGDLDVQLANLFVLAATGRDADVWIIGALMSLLAGVCLVIVGRRRSRVATR